MTDLETYYNNLCDKHPPGSAAAVDGNAKALEKRYEVLTNFDLSGKTILDVGCGQANIYNYLYENKRKGHFFGSYTGIDISERMIDEAKKVHQKWGANPKDSFIHTSLEEYNPVDLMTDKMKQYDFVVAQGLFYRIPKTEDGYSQVLNIVKKMWKLSRDKVAFCCLSTWGDDPDDELLIDPVLMLGFIREFITKNVIVNHSYLPHDVLFVMGREDY